MPCICTLVTEINKLYIYICFCKLKWLSQKFSNLLWIMKHSIRYDIVCWISSAGLSAESKVKIKLTMLGNNKIDQEYQMIFLSQPAVASNPRRAISFIKDMHL